MEKQNDMTKNNIVVWLLLAVMAVPAFSQDAKTQFNPVYTGVLYEYCEWIMLGNKYPDADMMRMKAYYKKAYELIKKIIIEV